MRYHTLWASRKLHQAFVREWDWKKAKKNFSITIKVILTLQPPEWVLGTLRIPNDIASRSGRPCLSAQGLLSFQWLSLLGCRTCDLNWLYFLVSNHTLWYLEVDEVYTLSSFEGEIKAQRMYLFIQGHTVKFSGIPALSYLPPNQNSYVALILHWHVYLVHSWVGKYR